jgi:hypothetical protein
VALGGTERIDFSVNGLVIDFGRPVLSHKQGVFFPDALFAAKGALDRDGSDLFSAKGRA